VDYSFAKVIDADDLPSQSGGQGRFQRPNVRKVEMTDKKTAQLSAIHLSAIGMDARDGLKAWRLCSPTEFNRKVDAMVAEVKALRRMMLPYNAVETA
jgi:hypothetical protein